LAASTQVQGGCSCCQAMWSTQPSCPSAASFGPCSGRGIDGLQFQACDSLGNCHPALDPNAPPFATCHRSQTIAWRAILDTYVVWWQVWRPVYPNLRRQRMHASSPAPLVYCAFHSCLYFPLEWCSMISHPPVQAPAVHSSTDCWFV
jgi:hypothetical protein